jgi:hypothetical protein
VQSTDGGATWSEAVLPHRDGTATQHGFVSYFPLPGDSLGAVWLDGRRYDERLAKSEREMMLMHTALAPDGSLGAEQPLDTRVCSCCQTAAAVTSRGPVVVYRDRSGDEMRDIAIVRRVDNRWTEPQTVHPDGWRIEGCPVNGPSIAADGERVAVAWFTASNDTPRVRLAFSEDAGASFSAPVQIDDGDPVGRVDVRLLDDGSAVVSWIERLEDGAEIRLRRVSADGRPGTAAVIAASSGERASGFPRIARTGDALVFAWTEPGDPTTVRTARMPLPAVGW